MIRIGGYLPFSLNDFPGRPAAVVFTQGCNYRCPYCHNPQLIPDSPGAIDPETVFTHLRERQGRLSAVVITGGEPTLQEDLPAFCRELRRLGCAIKLDTNGSRPEVVDTLLDEGLLDYLAVDLKTSPERYPECGGEADFAPVGQLLRTMARRAAPGHFRTTCDPSLVGAADLAVIRSLVPAGYTHVEQEYRRA